METHEMVPFRQQAFPAAQIHESESSRGWEMLKLQGDVLVGE